MEKLEGRIKKMENIEVRRGKWSQDETVTLNCLPIDIQHKLDELDNSDYDWAMSKGNDGQMWLVSKHWSDQVHYTIVASVVKHESEEYSLE